MYLSKCALPFFVFACLSVLSATQPARNAPVHLAPETQIPEAVILKANSIAEDILGLRQFLRVREIEKAEFQLVRNEDPLHGALFKFKVLTDAGEKFFFAQLPHSGGEYDSLDEEIKFTRLASKAGVSPFSGGVRHALTTYEVENAVTLDKMLFSEEWRALFFENEALFLKRIGEAYGILNKRVGILHGNVELKNIMITRTKKVYLLDFSTDQVDGTFSRGLPKDSEENDLGLLFSTMASLIERYKEKPWVDEIKKQGASIDRRAELYRRWLIEGFAAADMEIKRQVHQDEIIEDLRLRFSRTKTPVKVLLNLDRYPHVGTWFESFREKVPQGDWARRALNEGLVEYYFFIPSKSGGVLDGRLRLWTTKKGWFGRKIVELEYEDLKEAKAFLTGSEAVVMIDACSYSMKWDGEKTYITDTKYLFAPAKQLLNFIISLRLMVASPVYFAESPDIRHRGADEAYHKEVVSYLLGSFNKLIRWKKHEKHSKKENTTFPSVENKFSLADTIAPTVKTGQSL